MKRPLALLSLLFLAVAAHAQGMGQPGFYGRIEIGNGYPQPPLLFPNALMGNPGVFSGQPYYMHVPPHHAHFWSSHCQRYAACDWMVYFVDNSWYDNVYVPAFRSGAYAPPVYVAPPVYRPYPYPVQPPHYHPAPHMRPPPYPGPTGRPPSVPGGSGHVHPGDRRPGHGQHRLER